MTDLGHVYFQEIWCNVLTSKTIHLFHDWILLAWELTVWSFSTQAPKPMDKVHLPPGSSSQSTCPEAFFLIPAALADSYIISIQTCSSGMSRFIFFARIGCSPKPNRAAVGQAQRWRLILTINLELSHEENVAEWKIMMLYFQSNCCKVLLKALPCWL